MIERYFNRHSNDASLVLGIGDDCALVQPTAGQQLALSIDTLVAGVHFPASAQAGQIASRALCTAVSDLAAMGADAKWFTLALSLPTACASETWLDEFSASLFTLAQQFDMALIGGDTTRAGANAPLTVSVQVHGEVPCGKALVRSGAGATDRIFVSNCIGDGAAALAMLLPELAQRQPYLSKLQSRPELENYLIERFYRPQPQLLAGVALRGIASAAIDISDGLVADMGHICGASSRVLGGVLQAQINLDNLPLSDALRQLANDHQQAMAWALSGGDDYQLCFTVAEEKLSQLQQLQVDLSDRVRFTEIGRMQLLAANGVSEASVVDASTGLPFALNVAGFCHF